MPSVVLHFLTPSPRPMHATTLPRSLLLLRRVKERAATALSTSSLRRRARETWAALCSCLLQLSVSESLSRTPDVRAHVTRVCPSAERAPNHRPVLCGISESCLPSLRLRRSLSRTSWASASSTPGSSTHTPKPIADDPGSSPGMATSKRGAGMRTSCSCARASLLNVHGLRSCHAGLGCYVGCELLAFN